MLFYIAIYFIAIYFILYCSIFILQYIYIMLFFYIAIYFILQYKILQNILSIVADMKKSNLSYVHLERS